MNEGNLNMLKMFFNWMADMSLRKITYRMKNLCCRIFKQFELKKERKPALFTGILYS